MSVARYEVSLYKDMHIGVDSKTEVCEMFILDAADIDDIRKQVTAICNNKEYKLEAERAKITHFTVNRIYKVR